MRYAVYDHEGVLNLYTKQEVWAWLKAERKWQAKVRQWLKAEGLSGHERMLRRRGIYTAPPVFNRAYRRRLGMRRQMGSVAR